MDVPSKVDSYPPESYFFLKNLPINKKPPAVYVPTKPRIQIGRPGRPKTAATSGTNRQDSGTVGGFLTSRGRNSTNDASVASQALLSDMTKSLIRDNAPNRLIDYATSIDIRRHELDLELERLSKNRILHQQSSLLAVSEVASAAVLCMSGGDDSGGLIVSNVAAAGSGAEVRPSPLAGDGSFRRTASNASSRAESVSSPQKRAGVTFVSAAKAGPQLDAELLAISAPKKLKSFKSKQRRASGSVSLPSVSSPSSDRAHAALAEHVVATALRPFEDELCGSLHSLTNKSSGLYASNSSAALMVSVADDQQDAGSIIPLFPHGDAASGAPQPHAHGFSSPAVVGVVRRYEKGDDGDAL
jgi:hypothetical protein